jgi:DNA invertase Pin-like site-specific DNA recombinase
MKKVIQLIRVSTDRQAASDRASIPAQRTVNQRTCAQHGLEIVRSIEMADVSGACVLLAPETQELTQLMRSPEIHGVVAREFSRLMRPEDFEDFALLQVFVDTKTVLYLPEGPLDFSSKTGRLLGTMRAAIAGMERTEMLERVWSAKEEKRRRGELAQSKIVLPWGVDYENGRFFYKPEAEKVREAFRQFLGGKQNYLQLSKMLGVTAAGDAPHHEESDLDGFAGDRQKAGCIVRGAIRHDRRPAGRPKKSVPIPGGRHSSSGDH